MSNSKARGGFTLIEILIVVAIIAILASVVLVGLGPTQQAGRDARRLSDLRETQSGLELYFNKCGYYPGGVEASTPCGAYTAVTSWNASGGLTPSLTGSGLGINSVPNDPSAGHSYYYGAPSGGSTYVIAAILENANESVFQTYTAPSNVPTMVGDSGAPAFTSCTASSTYCLTL